MQLRALWGFLQHPDAVFKQRHSAAVTAFASDAAVLCTDHHVLVQGGVVFEKEGPDWYLRILIDWDGTMDTDTCAEVSHALDPILDEADPIDQSYYLEVGSPGLGRKLTRPEHYEALKGQKIRVKLIRPNADGVREFSGILTGREGSTVTVNTDAGAVTFEVNAASSVNLCDDEDLFD